MDPTLCTEEGMAVGSETTKLMSGRFIAYDANQNDSYEASLRMFGRLDNETSRPKPDEFIYRNAHETLDLVSILLVRAWHDTV